MNVVKFTRKSANVMIPKKGTEYSAGIDLFAADDYSIPVGKRILVDTGISIELPTMLFGLLTPRSGLASKFAIDVIPGTIDPDYRGNIKVIVHNNGQDDFKVENGCRIAQLIICKLSNAMLKEVVHSTPISPSRDEQKTTEVDVVKFTSTSEDVVIRTKTKEYSMGLYLLADDEYNIPIGKRVTIKTNLSIELPQNLLGLVLSCNDDVSISAALDVIPVVIDPDYRGTVKIIVYNNGQNDIKINKSCKVARIIILESSNTIFKEADELTPSLRGEKGFGSTGLN